LFEQLRDDVDANDLAHERRQRDRKRAGANVEGALLACQRQQAAQPLLRLSGAQVLQLRDQLSRLAEALANSVGQARAPPFLVEIASWSRRAARLRRRRASSSSLPLLRRHAQRGG